jgi:hypothetical protein
LITQFKINFNHNITLSDSYLIKNNKFLKKQSIKSLNVFFEAYINDNEHINKKELFENGWLPDFFENELKWYPCRSTRFKIANKTKEDNYYYNLLKKNNYIFKIIEKNEIEIYFESIEKNYLEFCKFKNFTTISNLKDILIHKNIICFLILNENNEVFAFDFCYFNDNILYSIIVGCNYNYPKLQFSKMIRSEQFLFCLNNKIDYHYYGEGYEESTLYKSRITGFEWWTGTEWTTDTKIYNELCIKDELTEE